MLVYTDAVALNGTTRTDSVEALVAPETVGVPVVKESMEPPSTVATGVWPVVEVDVILWSR